MEERDMLLNNLEIHEMRSALPRYFGQDFRKRVEYRSEFIRRNEGFRHFIEELTDFDFGKRGNKKAYNHLLVLGRKLFPEDPIFASGILRVPHERLVEELAMQSMTSIEIIAEKKGSSRSRYIEYQPLDDYSAIKFRARDRILRPVIAEAINRKNKTVTIKIHLDRQKDDIRRDLSYLLDLLKWETMHLKEDIGKSKRPQWDVYDKYLRVYDVKTANPRLEWSEIAKQIFPGEVEKDHKAPHRKTRKNELASDSAISKVFRYWKQADKMINKGGWRKI